MSLAETLQYSGEAIISSISLLRFSSFSISASKRAISFSRLRVAACFSFWAFQSNLLSLACIFAEAEQVEGAKPLAEPVFKTEPVPTKWWLLFKLPEPDKELAVVNYFFSK